METPLTTPDLWAEATSCTGQEVVFIVGSPRSGTTWLQRLLATHPHIKTGQESHVFSFYIAPQLRRWRKMLGEGDDADTIGRTGLGLAGYLSEEQFLTLLRQYVVLMEQAAGLQSGDLFLEKSPSHSLVMSEIRTVLPQSRFIHLVRDPRDVVASLVAASHSWGKGWAPSDPEKAAGVWVKHVKAVREASATLTSDEFIQVRYEDLCADTPATLQTLSTFLGLDWPEEQIGHAVDANRVDKMKRGGGTPIPVYGHHGSEEGKVVVEPEGFVRKARPGAGKEDLSLIDKKRVWQKVHPTMKDLGYSWKLTDWI